MSDPRPTKWAIVQHWAAIPDGDVFAPHLDIEHPCCFACGWYSERWKEGRSTRVAWERASLERAHIIPAGLGGADKPGNVILLCKICHEESPDWFDPWEMANWIRGRPERPSKEMEQVSLWLEAVEEVYEFPEMLAKLASSEDGAEQFARAMRKASRGVVVHGAGVGLRKATMTAVLRRAAAEILRPTFLPRLPTPRSRRALEAVHGSADLADAE